MFIRRKPRLVPLTIPQAHLIPLPEPNAMLHYPAETLAFASLARDLARDPEIREQSSSLVTGLVGRFRPEPPNQAEEETLLKALGTSVRLGWAFAKVEETLKNARPGFSDGRIRNAVIGAARGLSDFPEELQMKMFYALQCGYYVGRTGDRDGVLGGDASEGSPPGAGGRPGTSRRGKHADGQRFIKLCGRLGYSFDDSLKLKAAWKAMHGINGISPEDFLMELTAREIDAYDPFQLKPEE